MPHDSAPIETLRLSPRDKQKLVEYIEQSGKKSFATDQRNLRVDFHGRKTLVTITNSHGQRVSHSVLPRNLSRRGLAFVHGRFVYPDSRCQITMPMSNGKWYVTDGVVRNCRHIQGIIHEIAIVFDEKLNLNDFVSLTASQQEKHRAEQNQDFDPLSDMDVHNSGRTLVVDKMATDRKLYRLWLEKMNMATDEASGITTTIEQMTHGQFDLIMVNLELGDESGLDLIKHLRGQGYERPIIGTSASDNPAAQAAALGAGATAFLVKPFTLDELRVAVEDALLIDTAPTSEADSVYSSMAEDQEMLPLIEEFVNTLGPTTLRLRRANADADLQTISALCQNLKGAGAGYGFDSITTMARYAVESLDAADRDAEAVRKSVNELVQMLRRARSGVAADSEK